MYRFDLNKLKRGDIILVRDDSPLSKLVREKTCSQYSHALLYLGAASCLDAEDIVISTNLQRRLVQNKEDVCVLRLKSPVSDSIMDDVETNARINVGMKYSFEDAKAIVDKTLRPGNSRRQTCTRFVAQAYANAGIHLVEDAAFCTPEELLTSKMLVPVDNALVEATEQDIEIANSPSILPDQKKMITNLLKKAREITGVDIQEVNELKDFVIQHLEWDEKVSEILSESGFFEFYKVEEERNQQDYDLMKFLDFYQNNAKAVANNMIEPTESVYYRATFSLHNLMIDQRRFGNLKVLNQFVDYYKAIIDQCKRRLALAKTVLEM